jgi:hypothetical protein
MNVPKDFKKFVIKPDPLANLGTPGSMNKPPLKLATKGPIKIIAKNAIDKTSPQKEEGESGKIMKMRVRPPSGRT